MNEVRTIPCEIKGLVPSDEVERIKLTPLETKISVVDNLVSGPTQNTAYELSLPSIKINLGFPDSVISLLQVGKELPNLVDISHLDILEPIELVDIKTEEMTEKLSNYPDENPQQTLSLPEEIQDIIPDSTLKSREESMEDIVLSDPVIPSSDISGFLDFSF